MIGDSFPKPVVVVSGCLGFEHCRYNGETIPDAFVERMKPLVRYRTICPEVEIGLGVPRKPMRVVASGGRPRLVQAETGLDITDRMLDYVDGFTQSLGPVDGFVLKNRSPSCGINDVRVYSGEEKGAGKSRGPGFFGGAVAGHFSHLAVEDEGRLKNQRIRGHFLTKLFTLAAFHQVKDSGEVKDLVRFQARNKLLLMAHSQKQLRALGRLAANPQKRPYSELVLEYEGHLQAALSRPARCTSRINVMHHALGYFSKQLTSAEKEHFLLTLERYRQGKVPSSALATLMWSWVVRFQQPYLMEQTVFRPYPDELVEVTDSGKEQACADE